MLTTASFEDHIACSDRFGEFLYSIRSNPGGELGGRQGSVADLTNHCRKVLLQWRAMLGSDFSRYVFPSTRISEMHITDYKGAWRRAAEEAGLKDRRIYDLRSTFASRANSCRASG